MWLTACHFGEKRRTNSVKLKWLVAVNDGWLEWSWQAKSVAVGMDVNDKGSQVSGSAE